MQTLIVILIFNPHFDTQESFQMIINIIGQFHIGFIQICYTCIESALAHSLHTHRHIGTCQINMLEINTPDRSLKILEEYWKC